ncbi:peptidase [Pseudomonas marginalis ICMP 9505]|nr:peptidase [Pseudomonas marginalis ICMP 9505]
MALTKPNQQLRRDLKAIAFNLEQSCVDLGRLASRLSDADAIALMGLVGRLYEEADRLEGYAHEVKSGQIVRTKVG